MDGRQAPHVGLVLRYLCGPQLAYGQTVLSAALDEGVQPGQLRALGGDDQLAGDVVRNAVLRTELDHFGRPLEREPRLEGAGRVVDPAVDHTAVAPRLVAGGAGLLLQDGDSGAGRGAGEGVGGGQTDDAGADHQHIAVHPRATLPGDTVPEPEPGPDPAPEPAPAPEREPDPAPEPESSKAAEPWDVVDT